MNKQQRAKLGIYRILTEQYNQKPEQAQQVLFEMFKEINLTKINLKTNLKNNQKMEVLTPSKND
jgi:hypothetical protein